MRTKIAILALAALLFASCNKNDELKEDSNFPADGVIRVATSVTNPETRAGLTTENLNNMGFHVVNLVSPAYCYSNVKMSYADNKWSSEKTMLWQSASQVVKIMAYSPYVDGATNIAAVPFAVMIDQSKADNVKASDFVYQTIDFTPNTNLVDGKVNLNLSHVMSKLVATIKLGTEFNATPGTATNPIASVTVNGTKVECVVDFQNDAHVKPENLRGDAKSVLMYQESYAAATDPSSNATSEYQCILLPQVLLQNTFVIDIFIKGKGTYKYTLSNEQTFAVGKIYALTLNVGKDMVTAGSMTMKEWEPGNGGNYETE